jgi:hypothetical protein
VDVEVMTMTMILEDPGADPPRQHLQDLYRADDVPLFREASPRSAVTANNSRPADLTWRAWFWRVVARIKAIDE